MTKSDPPHRVPSAEQDEARLEEIEAQLEDERQEWLRPDDDWMDFPGQDGEDGD